jgi:hypothetical protein
LSQVCEVLEACSKLFAETRNPKPETRKPAAS